MADKLYQDEAWLRHQYLTLEKSANEIAEDTDAGITTVHRWLKRYNIKTRKLSVARRLLLPKTVRDCLSSKDWLERQYVELEKSSSAIARGLGVSHNLILDRLVEHGIPVRKDGAAQHIAFLTKTVRVKLSNVDWLKDQYGSQLKGSTQIARELGVSYPTVRNALIRAGIIFRDRKSRSNPQKHAYELNRIRVVSEETKEKISISHKGKNNPAWVHGNSCRKYCRKFNEELKERVREAFNRKCFLCPEVENGKRLAVHHINFDKQSGCFGKKWNLMALCQGCHNKTNFNRWYWFNLLINYWAMNTEINFSAVEGWQYHGTIKHSKTRCVKRATMV